MNLSERDARVIWHPYTQHQKFEGTIPVVRGEAALLFDDQGKSYIDAISSWWVNLHGHGHPLIAARIYQQALLLEHVIFTHFTHEPAVTLAERLLKILPGDFTKIFYSDNGSTAVEVALKMCIQYWKNKNQPRRSKVIAFENAYHGDTFGAMSVSSRGVFTRAFNDLLFDVIFIETPSDGNLEKIKSLLTPHRDSLAAFIYEPLLQAAGGMKMFDAAPMDDLLNWMHSENILCIADEVLTGFGRTGSLFAGEKLNQKADLICLSKGLTGGSMALGVTACSQSVFNAFLSTDRSKTFFHGHSFTANPIACAAALASLDLLEENSCRQQISWIQQQHVNFLQNEWQAANQNVMVNARALGTVLAFELESGKHEYINEVSSLIMQRALSRGIYLRPLGNTVYTMPPYCISAEQLRKIYDFLLSIPDFVRKN